MAETVAKSDTQDPPTKPLAGSPCIYCGSPADSAEHWLSRGFGSIRAMTLLRERVCVQCNNALGELDEEILRTGPTGYFRNLLGIKGRRRHSSVDVFTYRAVSGPQPTTLTMKAPHKRYDILAESYRDEQGRNCARPLRQIVVEKKDGGIECVPFRRDWNADTLKASLHNRNLDASKLLEIYLTGDETAESIEYRKVLGHVFDVNSGATVWYGTSESSTLDTTTLVAGIKHRYVRGIAKLGFHYLLAHSTTIRGDEPQFASIREFIKNGKGSSNEFVELNSPQFVPTMREGYVPDKTSHFFLSDVSRESVLGRVQLFVGPDMPPPALINLGSGLNTERWLSCHWVKYFGEKTEGYDGAIERVEVRLAPDK